MKSPFFSSSPLFPFVHLQSSFFGKIRIFPDKLPVAQVERALRQEELLQRMRNSVEKALAVAVKGSEDVRKTAEKGQNQVV